LNGGHTIGESDFAERLRETVPVNPVLFHPGPVEVGIDLFQVRTVGVKQFRVRHAIERRGVRQILRNVENGFPLESRVGIKVRVFDETR
jgi:hypothetical protein